MLHLLRRILPPPPDGLDVRVGDGTVRASWRRNPSARRLTLRVSGATRAVVLTTPPGISTAQAQRFLDAQAGWIAHRVASLPDRVPFAEGAILPLRGEPHRVARLAGRGVPAATRDPATGEWLLSVPGEAAVLPGRLRRFLAGEAATDLGARVAVHAAALGARAERITVRDTRSRWGSCSAAGHLSFSWRLILAPPFVLDYLAAHEVAHLRELNHSRRFWTLTRDLCPRTDEAEAWLKRHGPGLHRFG